MDKISVIVPVYNVEEYLETLRSLDLQSNVFESGNFAGG